MSITFEMEKEKEPFPDVLCTHPPQLLFSELQKVGQEEAMLPATQSSMTATGTGSYPHGTGQGFEPLCAIPGSQQLVLMSSY